MSKAHVILTLRRRVAAARRIIERDEPRLAALIEAAGVPRPMDVPEPAIDPAPAAEPDPIETPAADDADLIQTP